MARGLDCLRGRPTIRAPPFSARLPVTHMACLPLGPSQWSDSLLPLLGSADSLPCPQNGPHGPNTAAFVSRPPITAGLGHPPLCPPPLPGTELATGQGLAGSLEKQPKALECGIQPPPPTPQAELTVKVLGPSLLLGVFRVKVGSQGTAAAPRRLGPAGTACPLPAPPSGWDGPQPTPNVSKGLSDGSRAASRENRHLVARAVGLV